MDVTRLSIGLTVLGLGIALVLGIPPNWWQDMPPDLVRIGVGLGIVLILLGLALTANSVPRHRQVSTLGPWVLIIGGPVIGLLWLYLKAPVKNSPPSKPLQHAEIIWDDHLGHTYANAGAAMITQAFQIGAVNKMGHELRLTKAYAVSGEGYGEKPLLVATSDGWVAADQTNPIADGQRIMFRVQFGSQLSREVFEKWKTFQITIQFAGGLSRKDVTEQMVRAVYKNFEPNVIGPQVTPKSP